MVKQICYLLGAWLLTQSVDVTQAQAQSIFPASDGTGTIVSPNGNRIDISGGQLSRNGANLFHSFTQFNLSQGEIANFLSNVEIQNILGRVTGGEISIIDGLLQVSGGSSHLFLMNPAGIIFGNHASLNLPGSFTATTANGIKFGSNWFHATGVNDYSSLVGHPDAFAFNMPKPGSIINAGDLSVISGQNLTLVGGTIISTGKLSAPQGHILVSAAPGESWVRITSPEQVVGLEIRSPLSTETQPHTWAIPILSLPELLTGKGSGYVKDVSVNSHGETNLAGSNLSVETGDVTAKHLTAHTATLSASRNLTLVESSLTTTGDLNLLAGQTVQVRDSYVNPFIAHAQGNLYIQGDRGIDILALNHPLTPFQSGGSLSLVSDGLISGDSHFASKGNFSILNLSGQAGTFVSFYDPIISSDGDVVFGDYTGVALKVESLGSISTGNITITGPDTSLTGSDADTSILTSSRALILRAGLSTLTNPANLPQSQQGTSFTSVGELSSPASITAGVITTSAIENNVDGGPVILSAPGSINADAINSSSQSGNAGDISLSTNSGDINVAVLDSSTEIGNAGDISITSNSGDINISLIDSSTQTGNAGDISINSNSGSANLGLIDSSSQTGNAGDISINSNSGSTNASLIDSSTETGNSGDVSINSNSGSANLSLIDSSSQTGNAGDISINSNSGITNVSSINSSSQSGNTGSIFIISNSGSTNVNSPSTNVISTVSQSSTNQPSRDFSSIPSDIPYTDQPETFRNTETTAASIERSREKEFEDILGKGFPEKFTDAQDIRAALHTIENQFQGQQKKNKVAIIYATTGAGYLQLVLQTSESEYRVDVKDSSGRKVTKQELEEKVKAFREAIANPESLESDYKKHSRQLYDWLIKPIENNLTGKQSCSKTLEGEKSTLLFSMDKGLRFIPLAALQDSSGCFLIEKYAISLIPSFSYTDITYTPDITKYQVLAMGVSEFGGFKPPSPLAAASAEVTLFAQKNFWPAGNLVISDINGEARDFNVKKLNNLSDKQPFRVIHLATHAGFSEQEDPRKEFYIQFYTEKIPLNDLEKKLQWRDFRVDLLVLSACQTVPGIADSEKFFVGLSAKLGVKSTLASLWNVNDPGSLILMSEFYQNLQQPMTTKAEALRKAQLAMKNGNIDFNMLISHLTKLVYTEDSQLSDSIQERLFELLVSMEQNQPIREELKHPYYWATFTMIGSPW